MSIGAVKKDGLDKGTSEMISSKLALCRQPETQQTFSSLVCYWVRTYSQNQLTKTRSTSPTKSFQYFCWKIRYWRKSLWSRVWKKTDWEIGSLHILQTQALTYFSCLYFTKHIPPLYSYSWALTLYCISHIPSCLELGEVLFDLSEQGARSLGH